MGDVNPSNKALSHTRAAAGRAGAGKVEEAEEEGGEVLMSIKIIVIVSMVKPPDARQQDGDGHR